jgi:antitoxin component YwqK of YwqJK toxin-antitoxin module
LKKPTSISHKIGFLFVLFTFFSFNEISAQQTSGKINQLDTNNLKQGYWKITAEMRQDTGYFSGDIIEEGEFKNSRKIGLWVRYYPNGNKQSEITYMNGRPKGEYKTYYNNEKLEEEGNWVQQKNTGDFARYYSNGEKMQEFRFDENGVRNGKQLYFHENGKIEVEVIVIDGKEEGTMKRFSENGELKSEVEVSGGKADRSTYKEHGTKQDEVVTRTPKVEKKEAKIESPVKPNLGTVNPEGYNKLYTRSLLLKWDGYFHFGKPWNGKKYVYDQNGILQKIEIYKDGLYIGNGVIEKE